MAQKKHYKFKYGLAVGDVFVVDEATRSVKINNTNVVTIADLGDVYSIDIPNSIIANPTITDAVKYLVDGVGNINSINTSTLEQPDNISDAINELDHNKTKNIKGGNVIGSQFYHLNDIEHGGINYVDGITGVKHAVTVSNPVITKMCLGDMETLEVINQNTIEPYTNMVDAVNYVYDMSKASIFALSDTITNIYYCDYCGWFGEENLLDNGVCPVCGENVFIIDKHDSRVKSIEIPDNVFTVTDYYAGYNLIFTSSNPVTVKLPHISLKENSQFNIIQGGTGSVTIIANDVEIPSPTININSLNNFKKVAGRYGCVYVFKRSRDLNGSTSIYNISGDLISV